MKLYHFTCVEYLPSILEEGLTRGDVPVTKRKHLNAVWLTRNPDPGSQGWAGEPRVANDADRDLHETLFGERLPPDARFPDKRAVVLTVEIPDHDPRLVGWVHFANQRGVNRRWRALLNRVGGAGELDWFLYRGVVPRDWIIDVKGPTERAQANIARLESEPT